MQVRAHKVRKRRRLDPDSPLLEFEEPDLLPNEESPLVRQRSNWAWEHEATTPMHSPAPGVHEHSAAYETSQSAPDVAVEEPIIPAPAVVQEEPIRYYEERITERPPLPPLAPFPRITAPLHKVIEFPRMQPRQYELADPVADQLRIFEAVEELPRPAVTHLSTIEIAPEEPAHITAAELEVPIQAAPVPLRAYAAAVDSAVMIAALALFAFSADFFASSLPRTKPLVACAAVCTFLLLTLYYLLSFSLHRNTVGIDAAGLKVITFSGDTPSRTRLRCRALATVLSYAALGMGFAWSFIDEDRLCWHDRITHTYLSSK